MNVALHFHFVSFFLQPFEDDAAGQGWTESFEREFSSVERKRSFNKLYHTVGEWYNLLTCSSMHKWNGSIFNEKIQFLHENSPLTRKQVLNYVCELDSLKINRLTSKEETRKLKYLRIL